MPESDESRENDLEPGDDDDDSDVPGFSEPWAMGEFRPPLPEMPSIISVGGEIVMGGGDADPGEEG